VKHAGSEIRLKDLLNIQLPALTAEALPDPVRARFTSRENRRLPRIQWVGVEGSVPVDLLDLEGHHALGRGEAALRRARPRDVLQFERVGFVRVESDWTPGAEPVRVCFGHP
jgi:hypothetical protein